MCLIAFHWQPDSDTPLVVAANRDEFYDRPTMPLAWWEQGRILAGRDLKGNGTWMGLSSSGRFAALTNYRDPLKNMPHAPSRGNILTDFLESELTAADYILRLHKIAHHYNDFNLLIHDGQLLLGYESRYDCTLQFSPGSQAVSNARFDTPWPKVMTIRSLLDQALSDDSALLQLLADRSVAIDACLPSTGVAYEWERALSAAFICTPEYGTRSSSIIRLSKTKASFFERRFEQGAAAGDSCIEYKLSRQ